MCRNRGTQLPFTIVKDIQMIQEQHIIQIMGTKLLNDIIGLEKEYSKRRDQSFLQYGTSDSSYSVGNHIAVDDLTLE